MSEEANKSDLSSALANVNQNCHTPNSEEGINALTPPTVESYDVEVKNEAPSFQEETKGKFH